MWMTCRTESFWPIANDNRRIGLPSGNQPWLAGKLMSAWSPQLQIRHLHLDDFPTMFDDRRIFVWYLQEVDAGSAQRFSTQRPVALSLCVSPPGWMERYPGQRRKRLGLWFFSWNWMFDNFLDSFMFKAPGIGTMISGNFFSSQPVEDRQLRCFRIGKSSRRGILYLMAIPSSQVG